MQKILLIDACCREESRTRELAQYALSFLEGVKIPEDVTGFVPLSRAELYRRIALTEAGRYDDPLFAPAKRFAEADVLVFAAPHWDLSFPACLKAYIERICVTGLTFRYTPEGCPEGLIRAKRLLYIATTGGYAPEGDPFGFGYIRALCTGYFGVTQCERFVVEGLDIYGADVQALMREGKERIRTALT